jgi:hypothetical protein
MAAPSVAPAAVMAALAAMFAAVAVAGFTGVVMPRV